MRGVLLVLVLLTTTQAQTTNRPVDAALLDAAQQDDLAGVQRALQQGANVNARTRYNATALTLGAMNGNLEIVRALIERGADLSVRDTFYNFTPIAAATMNGRIDVIRYLVERGSPGSIDALTLALQRSNAPLFSAVLANKEVPDRVIAAAHAAVLKTGNADMIAAAKSAMTARSVSPSLIVTLPSSALQALTGSYAQAGQAVVIALKDDQLLLTLGGQTVQIFPTSELTFVSPERPTTEITFERQGDRVERLSLRFGPQALQFARAAAGSTPAPAAPAAPAAAAASPTPTVADLAVAPRGTARPWPSFRGANAAGAADGQGAVVEWDVASGRNVRWKTPIPGISTASPIVFGDRVYIATSVSTSDKAFRTGLYGDTAPVNDLSEHSWKLYALDTQNGRIVWEREVHKAAPRVKRHPKSSHSSSTPVTDGKRIAVLYGTVGILAVYDVNGRQLWKKDLGLLDNGWFFDVTHQWGHSSSPIIYQDAVILQVDRQKDSFLAAYDLASGKELWRTPRTDEIPTWGTPTIARGRAGDEIITNGTKVRGYDAETGKLRWTIAPNSEITVATPVVGSDLVYVTGGYPPARPIYAIRPGFSGDLSLPKGGASSEAIAWSNDREGTYIPTPVLYRGILYTFNINGIITAYDAQTGERIYRARVGAGGSFSASPIAADGRLYFASEDGEVYVAKAGREYLELAKHDMKEVIMATPAISNGLLVVRTMQHVYGIGAK
jgi:outer membrane protein assembly factor BamB